MTLKPLGARAGACVLLTASALALAPHSGAAESGVATVELDIPSGDTAQALNAFSQQAGVQMMFPYAAAIRYRTAGLKGTYDRETAVRRLIAGTNLELASASSDTITVRERATDTGASKTDGEDGVDQVIVTARAGTTAQKQIEASYAVTSVSEERIRMAAPVSLADALKSVPGVWVEPAGGEAAANVRVRGIPSDGYSSIATYEDGLPVQHDGGLDWFNTDESFRLDETTQRLEAVRGGPSSIFASYAPGGVMNFITRRGSDKPESLFKVQAGDYGYSRGDFWVGGPVAGLRVGFGGFYRKDHGVRDPGFDADKGGQLRFSVGKDFDNGSLDCNVKRLDDNVIFYLGVPLTNDSHGNPHGIPGFDPLYDTFSGPESAHLTFRTNVGPYNFDLTRGVHTELTQYTTNFKYELSAGWQLTDGIRYRTSTMNRTGLFPNSPFTTAADRATQFLEGLPSELGAVSTRYVYVNHPGQAFDVANQNANGLVMPASAREQDASLDELINDLRLQRKFDGGEQSHDVAVGVYFAKNEETFLQRGSQLLVDVRPHAQLLDVLAMNAAGQVVQHLTDNGFVRYGSQYEHGLGDSKSHALYLSDEWQISEKLRLDMGGRWEHVSLRGRAEESEEIDLEQTPTPADDRANMGTGVFDPWTHKYNGWSATLAANYQFRPDFGVFARLTKGLRLPSLGSFITDPTNQEPRVASIKLAEAGVKSQGEHYEFYGTAFYTGFDSLPFGETVFDPATDGFVSRTSFADTVAYGVELEGTLRPSQWFDLSLNATLQSPRFGDFKFTDEDGPHDFSHNLQTRTPKVNMRATPGVNLFGNKLRAQLSIEYYGKRFGDAANTVPLPSYHLLGAEVRYTLTDSLSFYAYGTNLTNELGLDQGNPRAGQIVSGDAGQKYFLATPQFGRTFRLAVMYRK